MIYTIIAKPTKECNADCNYCSSPPDSEKPWNVEKFKIIWDRVSPLIHQSATWIWHGGEPLLLSPKFYEECYKIARQTHPEIRFSIQSNLLLYKTKRWKKVFEDVFEGRISTSFDPDELNRTIHGSSEKYTNTFNSKIEEVINDGFYPMVIGTYDEKSIHLASDFLIKNEKRGNNALDIRINYRYPAGRITGETDIISPETYGKELIKIYNNWIKSNLNYKITPLDQMFVQFINKGRGEQQCPWTRSCGGTFLGIQPNGDLYNCGEFSDLEDERFKYGNAFEGWVTSQGSKQVIGFRKKINKSEDFISNAMSTKAAISMKSRRFNLPDDCKTCRHFDSCQGGCMRDAELYERGIGGKFYYCQSWKMVFDRIKESIIDGDADNLLIKYGFDPEVTRKYI